MSEPLRVGDVVEVTECHDDGVPFTIIGRIHEIREKGIDVGGDAISRTRIVSIRRAPPVETWEEVSL